MAVIMTEINGVLCSSLDEYGYLLCDHQCKGCVADGRCEAQRDNNEAQMADWFEWLNSDEHSREEERQRNEWHNSEAHPVGPEHCWGCKFENECNTADVARCLFDDSFYEEKIEQYDIMYAPPF